MTPIDILTFTVKSNQKEGRGAEEGWGGRVRPQHSLAKFGPGQWGVLEPQPSVGDPYDPQEWARTVTPCRAESLLGVILAQP